MSSPASADLCWPSLFGEELDDAHARELASVLKALADPVRLRLLSIIGTRGEACACDFPALLGKSQPTISHHLAQLVAVGIVEREQRGKWAWFSIDHARVAEIRAVLTSPADGRHAEAKLASVSEAT